MTGYALRCEPAQGITPETVISARFACEKAERASQQDTPLTEGRFYAQFYKIGDYGLGSSPFGQTAS